MLALANASAECPVKWQAVGQEVPLHQQARTATLPAHTDGPGSFSTAAPTPTGWAAGPGQAQSPLLGAPTGAAAAPAPGTNPLSQPAPRAFQTAVSGHASPPQPAAKPLFTHAMLLVAVLLVRSLHRVCLMALHKAHACNAPQEPKICRTDDCACVLP